MSLRDTSVLDAAAQRGGRRPNRLRLIGQHTVLTATRFEQPGVLAARSVPRGVGFGVFRWPIGEYR